MAPGKETPMHTSKARSRPPPSDDDCYSLYRFSFEETIARAYRNARNGTGTAFDGDRSRGPTIMTPHVAALGATSAATAVLQRQTTVRSRFFIKLCSLTTRRGEKDNAAEARNSGKRWFADATAIMALEQRFGAPLASILGVGDVLTARVALCGLVKGLPVKLLELVKLRGIATVEQLHALLEAQIAATRRKLARTDLLALIASTPTLTTATPAPAPPLSSCSRTAATATTITASCSVVTPVIPCSPTTRLLTDAMDVS